MNRIGGALDYARLARLHKPADPAALAAEIQRQHAQGLKPRDIASHLAVHVDVVLRALSKVCA